MTTRCHSLLFVVIYCTIQCYLLYHWLSFVVTRCITLLSFYGISEKQDPRPRTLKVRPETLDPGPNSDPRLITLKVDFQQIFSVFFEAWRLWMNSCTLCIYVYFAGFSLPYHKAYTFLIFYHLNELLFPGFCKNYHHAAVMKYLKT